jgi:signal transduction histidine kinase/CheY-like chemotaxis protein/ligand-binding sensor domain-containing protein
MTRFPLLLRLLCVLLVANAVHAEEWTPARAFRTFNKATYRGLPQSSIMALAQDREGVLWIGTLDGTATFDGKAITPVDDVKAAPLRGVIAAIVARAKGGVYVASQAGVHIFDGAVWSLVPAQRAAVSLAEARDGVLWMTDTDGALWTLRGDKWQRRADVQVPVVAVAAASDGSIWAATDDGALHISGSTIEAIGGLTARPSTILVARDGRVWIATLGCTVHWTDGKTPWKKADFPSWERGGFRCMTEDRRGRIWVGSYGGRVAFGNAETPWTVWTGQNGPFDGGIMSLAGDREGSVWFGLNALGLAQWVGEEWSHRTVLDPAAATRVAIGAFGMSRTADGKGLLVSIFHDGVLRVDANGAHLYAPADGLVEDVRAAVEPQPGTIYAGTRFGIFESHDGRRFTQTLKLAGGFVMGFFRSPDGRWYAGSSANGVFVRDANGWQPVAAINSALEGLHVRDMKWRRNGELWVATLRGITIFRDGVDARHMSIRNIPALPESVNAVLEVSDDEIWAGGMGGIAIRRRGEWRRMTEADGIPGQTIYSLGRGSDGAIWAGGSAGAGRFANGRWTVWDARSGLLQEECNLGGMVMADDGGVYIGTMGGVAHFDPHVQPLPMPELKLFWRGAPAVRDRALHLRWSAPWLAPRGVEYRVRVPRLHDGWSAPSTEDHLDIENLGAGDWRVEVQARVDGTQSWSAPLTLSVKVPPFWYETIAARVAAVALLALIVYAIFRLRLRALHKRAAELEAIVRERTAELRASEQRALAASRAKSTFLATMSHELRTPLNGVLGFAQLLARRHTRDAEDRHGLEVIIRSGEHLLGLINDVLSLAKIEAGRITLEEKAFDLRTLLRDVEQVLRFRAEEKGLRFTIDLQADALPQAVRGDEMRVRQILINLAGNAVKFTEAGHVTVRATWRDGRARFEVEDSGAGIGADELPRLFEPFVQSESGQRSKEGTGLGLALSRNLARVMGGDITVESARGRGSCFTLAVPLPEAAAEAVAAEEKQVVALEAGHEPVRILVVDDVAVNREVLVRLLSQVGFEVREAADGAAAVETWRSWQPHLIWMDKMMRGVDGLEATRRIRAEEQTSGRKRTAILALSASALDHERDEILAAGCDDFVAKPFREATIFAKIREYLGVRYAERQVLLVDDDWVCREVATQILREQGVGVTAASSGAEALNLVGEKHFDLVLMDLRMPEMGGIETARRMRALARGAKLPIIAMSADGFDGVAEMDDYVGKPVDPASLAAVVKRWL